MRALLDAHTKYYKKVNISYSSGNAGGMYHYWDEYRAGATCAVKQMPYPMIVTSLKFQIGGWTNEFHEGYVINIHLQASNDGYNWVNVKAFGDRAGCNTWHTLDCSENKTAYMYYRFYAENGGWAYNDALSIASVYYYGYYTINKEVTESDNWDFIRVFKTIKGLKKTNIRKYYKSVTIPNGVCLGNLTINNCVVSGFTVSNYVLGMPEALSTDNAEYMFKFTTGSNITVEQQPVRCAGIFELYIKDSKMSMYNLGTETLTSFTCTANTTYWIKILINNSSYSYSYSTDGENFTEWAVGTDSRLAIQDISIFMLGNWGTTTTSRAFQGSIDFNECYSKSNGEFLWIGTRTEKGAETTEQDYDIYEDVYREYYKYIYEPFEQPVLTNNGIIGGDNFAVTALNTDSRTQPYYAFDTNFSDTYTAGWLSKASSNYFEWYNPNPINITQLKIQYQTTSASSVGYISKWDIKASNDGLNYVDIVSGGTTGNYGVTNIQLEHNNYYKYWRLYPITWSSEWYAIINMNIVAQEKKGIISSFEDYDYYIDNQPKYYAFKTYGKGQYYGNQSNS